MMSLELLLSPDNASADERNGSDTKGSQVGVVAGTEISQCDMVSFAKAIEQTPNRMG